MKYSIQTITPCHIGSGVSLANGIEFVGDGERIGIIDLRKVYELLGANSLSSWCRSIERKESVKDLIKKYRPNITINDYCSEIYDLNGEDQRIRQLNRLIRSNGLPYIPGSSLKGAIVSAIVGSCGNVKIPPFIQKKNNHILESVFGGDPQQSLLRFLSVGDSYFDNSDIQVVEGGCYNIRQDNTLNDNSLRSYFETIYTDNDPEVDITVNTDYYRMVKNSGCEIKSMPQSMSDNSLLMSTINQHTLKLLEREREFWADEQYAKYDLTDYLEQIDDLTAQAEQCRVGKEALLRVGAGSGWDFITGGWSREVANDDQWERIVELSRPRNYRYSGFPFPKSRKVALDTPLGFVKLTLIELKPTGSK